MAQEQNQSFFQHSLHLLVLSGFVLAQPLMQLIGGNVEFLVAQRIEGWEVLVLVLSLSLFIPGILLAVEYLALLINKTLYKVVHGGFIFLLITALFVLLLKRVASSGVEIIEIQIGDYLGEDDIVRFEDKYNRV